MGHVTDVPADLVPAPIAALGPEVQRRVEALAGEALNRQRRDLTGALDETLRLVPRPLRGVVRKVVGA